MNLKLLTLIVILFIGGCSSTKERETLEYTITKNPFGYAPLTAMVFVEQTQLPEEATARVSILGQGNEEMPMYYTIPVNRNDTGKAEIPIIGLYAGYNNQVELTFQSSGVELTKLKLEIQTEEIPFTFTETPLVKGKLASNELIFTTVYTFEIKKGEDMVFIQKSLALDDKGRIRWFSDFKGRSHVVIEIVDGYLYAGSNKGAFAGKLIKYDFLGKELEAYDISKKGTYGNIHHDIRKTNKGSFFLTVNEQDQPSVENIVLEYDPRLLGNNVQLELDLEDLLPNMDDYFLDLPFSYYAGKKDPLHINGIYPYPDGEHLLVSSRNAGLAKIHTSSYQIEWILFPHALKAAAAEVLLEGERGSRKYLEKRMQLYNKDQEVYQRKPANGIIPYQDYADFTFRYEEFLLHPINKDGTIIKAENVVNFGDTCAAFSYPYRQHAPIVLKNGNIALFDNGDRNKPGKNRSRAVEYKVIEDKDGYGGKVAQVWEYYTPENSFAPVVGDIRELDSGNRLVCFGSINFKNVPKPTENTEALIVELKPVMPPEEVFSLEVNLLPGSVLYRANKMNLSKLMLQ